MLIKPFKTIETIADTFKSSSKTEVHYIPKYSAFCGSEVVIVRKYIIKDFVTSGKPAYVKILTLYTAKNFHSKNFEEDLRTNSIPLRLKTSVVTAYDGYNNFGITLYLTDLYDNVDVMCVSSHGVDSNGPFAFTKSMSIDDIQRERATTIFPFIEENDDGTYNIDKAYSGCEEIKACVNLEVNVDLKKYVTPDTKITVYPYDMQEKIDTLSDINLMKISKQIFLGNNSNVAIHQSAVNDLLCKSDAIKKLIGGLNGIFIESMFDGITFIYKCGKVNIHKIDYPFDKQIPSLIKKGMERFSLQIDKLASTILEDLFGLVTLIIRITEGYTCVFCRFLEEEYSENDGIFWSDLTGNNAIKNVTYRNEAMSKYFETVLYQPVDEYSSNGINGELSRVYDLVNYYRGVTF